MRGGRPYVFTNLNNETGLDAVIDFIVEQGTLQPAFLLPV